MTTLSKHDANTPQWLTRIRLEIISLQKERAELEKLLLNPPKMKAGTVTIQYKTCGRKNCHCYDRPNPVKHGPYYYLVVQNTVRDGVRQQLLKDEKERGLYLNYRAYQDQLAKYELIGEKIVLLYQSIKTRRSHA